MEIDALINIELFNKLDVADGAFVKECAKISSDVRSKKATIVQVVEQLEPLLTDKLPENRQRGTSILSHVLQELPRDFLLPIQLSFICMFYCDRLKDHHTVIPAVIKGVLVLVECSLPEGEGQVSKLFSALFQNVSCQQQKLEDRHNIYKIFQISWDKHRAELLSMSFNFIYGVISCIDGERDPKNLLLLFQWLPTFVQHAQLGHLCEEMFEVMSCYFPVSFKPSISSREEQYITREDLAEALLPCLTAIPDFAENCLTLALENLASTLKESKVDALRLLEKGTETFPAEFYLRHVEILTDVQKEILSTKNAEIEAAALRSLKAVIASLSKNPENAFKPILQNIVDTVQGNLVPNVKLHQASLKIVQSLIEASPISSLIVAKQIVPLLSNTYNLTTTPSQKVVILNDLVAVTVAYLKTNNLTDLAKNADVVLEVPALVLKTAASEAEESRCRAFACLETLGPYLPLNYRRILCELLSKSLLSPDASCREFRALLGCFKVLVARFPQEVEAEVIRVLHPTDLNEIRRYFAVLSELVDQSYFCERVLEELRLACVGRLEKTKVFELEAGKAALNVLGSKTALLNSDFCTTQIASWALEKGLIDVENHWDYCQDLERFFKAISATDSENRENLSLTLEHIATNYQRTKNPALILPVNGLVCRDGRKKTKLADNLWNLIIEIAFTTTNNVKLHGVSTKLIGNIVNKAEEVALETYLRDLEENCEKSAQVSVEFIAFVAKGLIMRGHASKDYWFNKLANLLQDNERAALGFKHIMHDNYYEFSRADCFCTRRLLFQQQFFVETCKILVNSPHNKNHNYCLAFAYLLEETPGNILKLELSNVRVLLLSSLDVLQDSGALLALLETLKKLILDAEEVVEEHLEDFLTRFLKLTKFEASMTVRIAALQCLRRCADSYRIYNLVPHKTTVLFGLVRALDDKKRLVRREAVETRTRWFLIDAPE